jgi:predicted transcriptional regulator
MARANWISDDNHPAIDAHMQQLEHFTKSLADGVVDKQELATQNDKLVAAMRAAESVLNDDQHAKVTALLAELAAYTVMEMLHSMTQARVAAAIR